MGFNANLGSQSISEKQILDRTHPPVILAEDVKANQGELATGLIVAKDANKKIIPYKNDCAQSIGTGDGELLSFSGTLTNRPVCPGSVAVSDGAQDLADDGHGNLKGDGSGYINYETGVIEATFDAPPADQADIAVAHANQPVGVLQMHMDTTKETVGSVIKHGIVVKTGLLVGESAPDATDLARLEPMIVAI